MSPFRRALLRWLGHPEPMCPIPVPNCQSCRPEPLTPAEVGRGSHRGENILEAVAWLRSQGWPDDAGYLQQFATYLLRARADYERRKAMEQV